MSTTMNSSEILKDTAICT